MKKSIVLSTIVLFSSQILLPTVAIAETNQHNTTDSNNQNQVMIPADSSQVEDENTVSSEKDNNISEESSKHNSAITPSESNQADQSISFEENTSISNDTTQVVNDNDGKKLSDNRENVINESPSYVEKESATTTSSTDTDIEYGGLVLSDWQYQESSSFYTLQKYKGVSNKVKIPGKINGKPVRFLGMGQGGLFPNPKRSQITHVEAVVVDGTRPGCVGTLERAFQLMSNLEYVDLSNMDAPALVGGDRIDSMFFRCRNLQEVNLSGIDLSKVISAESVFDSCNNLKIIKGLDTLDVSKITSFKYMFANCSSLETIDLSSWDVSSLNNTQFMFDNCTNLKNVTLPDFSVATNFKGSQYMFYNCNSLTNIDLNNFTAPNLASIQSMFEKCSSLIEIDLTSLKTSQLRVLTGLFKDCTSLKKVDMPTITATAQYASEMFYNCPSLNFIDLTNFDSTGISAENFQNNFYIDSNENDTNKKLLVLATDEKLINYEYSLDGRIGNGPTMDANGGFFSDGKDIHKIDSIFVLPNLQQISIDTAIENAVKGYEIPTKTNHTFEGWNKKTEKVSDKSKDEQSIQSAFALLNDDQYIAKWSMVASVMNNAPIIKATDKVLVVGDVFNPLEGVTANDVEDGEIILTKDNIVTNDVDTSKAGRYNVAYKVTDNDGASTTKNILVIVKEKNANSEEEKNEDTSNQSGSTESSFSNVNNQQNNVTIMDSAQTNIKNNTKTQGIKKLLPNTGEIMSNYGVLCGIVLVFVGGLIVIKRKS